MKRTTALLPAFFLAALTSAVVPTAYVSADEKPLVVAQTSTVNINTASAEELSASLKGIGTSKAQAIVDYREKVGKFVSIDQLAEVKGIGAATVEKNRALIRLQ
ncbi:helix-hairpin-helix domain-containing protein [Simiduia agarivorans]|uniref:helix-hairpin-helix domain-containing protein n=1 Tax=Simiduia agarivorans TaxID=447471 RepID=UPI00046252EA